jgi:4-hydroxy-tetrahydrodipicolinate synthase
LKIEGSIVALVTPFKDGKVDEDTLRKLVRLHLESGTSALVPVGTTGESPTLSHEEDRQVIQVVIDEAGGKIPVIAGTGSNSTATTIETTRWAREAGASAALVVCPYYNKPTQEGVYQHYKAVAEEGGLPVVVYTIQGRTGINIPATTIERLAPLKNIVAVKEASGNVNQMMEIAWRCGDQIDIVSGDDPLTLPMISFGCTGVISVSANLIPVEMAELVRSAREGNWDRARELHFKYFGLFQALFTETNPIGIKTAMGLKGMVDPGMRAPLTAMTDANKANLQAAMKSAGIL